MLPVLETLKTFEVAEFITSSIFLVLPADVCFKVNDVSEPPLVISSLSVV